MPFDSPFSAVLALVSSGPGRVPLTESQAVPATGGVLALGQIEFDPTTYPAGSQFSFDIVMSVSLGSLTGSVQLYNVTDAEAVTGTSLATSALAPTPQSSGALTVGAAAGNLKDSAKVYEVRLTVSGALVTDLVSLGSASLVIQ